MSIVLRVDRVNRIVLARGFGTFTDDDAFSYQRVAWAGDEVATYDELIDMSSVLEIAITSPQLVRDLAASAARVDRASGTPRFAIVAPGNLAYGLGRMFQTYREMLDRDTKAVGVFRTPEEAAAFLNRAEIPLLPPLPDQT